MECEHLESGIQDSMVLEADESLVVTAQDGFVDTLPDGKKKQRTPGDKWMVHCPRDYIPRIEIGNVQRREGGGIGDESIRKVAYFHGSKGPVLSKGKGRDKTRVVTFRCPSNAAVCTTTWRKTARVMFGLVILNPHENFNVLSLSAGKPKKEGALKTICLMLGPDFISDHITVATSDHARLKVALSINEFRVE